MTRRAALALSLLAAAAALAACSNERSQQASAARGLLVGTPQSEILACAGVPDRSRVVGNVEYMTYESAEMISDQSAGVGVFGGGGFGIGGGGGVGVGVGIGGIPLGDVDIAENYCEATFTVIDGRVAELNYSVSGGQRRMNQCYDIVASCLASRPAAAPG
jgi:hypothetical protein